MVVKIIQLDCNPAVFFLAGGHTTPSQTFRFFWNCVWDYAGYSIHFSFVARTCGPLPDDVSSVFIFQGIFVPLAKAELFSLSLSVKNDSTHHSQMYFNRAEVADLPLYRNLKVWWCGNHYFLKLRTSLLFCSESMITSCSTARRFIRPLSSPRFMNRIQR